MNIDPGNIINAVAALAAVAAVVVALYIYRADQRPDVVAYLEANTDIGTIMLVIANTGNSSARDVHIEGFDQSMCMPEFQRVALRGFMDRGVPCLVPGAERRTTLAETRWVSNNKQDATCEVTIRYRRKGLFGRLVDEAEAFSLDYYSFSNSLYVMSDMHQIKNSMEKIQKSLASIESSQRSTASIVDQTLGQCISNM